MTGAIARTLAAAVLLSTVSCRRGDENVASGTIEVVEVDVSPTQPARLLSVHAREGDRVRAGQQLAVLSQSALPSDITGRQARVSQAEANLRDVQQGARPAEVAQAEAALRTAQAEVVRTQRDLDRNRPLAAKGIVPRQQLDAYVAAAREAASRRDAARAALGLVREGARPERVNAAQAEVASARAALQSARATAGDLVLVAPTDGVVMGRWAEPGETVTAGQAVLTLGRTDRPYTRIYVGEKVLPRLKVGQQLVATLDGYPDRRFRGRIAALADRAEYTPRVALTETERADLLFGVKVEFDDASGMLKPGLPLNVHLPETP
jgi:HlyD family secretion protein